MATCKTLIKLGSNLLQQTPVFHTSVRYRLVKKNEKLASKSMNWSKLLFDELRKDEIKEESKPSALLHLVTRVKTLKGRPYWEKDTMKRLGLHTRKNVQMVHKNSPSVNEMLKSVKHLVNIVPITFPNGLPENESDYEHCLLRDNGEFVIRKKILPGNIEVVSAPKSGKDVLWKMDPKTLDRHLILQLRHRRLNAEYFPAKYVYKYNQDGKEYRYKGQNTDDEWY